MKPTKRQAKERPTPRISVNKLGEYLTASPVRRRSIIIDQKRPRDFIVARYTDAQDALTRYLASPEHNPEIIYAAIASLGEAPTKSVWDVQNAILCAEALEAYLDFSGDLQLDGVLAQLPNDDSGPLGISGVSVSVRPDVNLRVERTGKVWLGAVKLHFAKNNPLSDEAASYVATLVYRYAGERTRPGVAVDPRLCMVVDVFGRKVYRAPRAYVRKLRDIEAACEEIARAWPAV